MVEVHVLGALELVRTEAGEHAPVSLQPKQLAVLTYLLLDSAGRLHRRDALLALFWPDLDDKHARNALNQLVFQLRGALGREVVVSQGPDWIGVAGDDVWCDAIQFDEHLSSDRHSLALSLYRGDLLEGFHVDVLGFERWLDLERARLKRRAVDAATTLADECEREGDLARAGDWLRRGLGLRPTQESLARRLITLLGRLGDPAGAVAEFERLRRHLEEEYGLEPSEQTVSIVEAIRAGEIRPEAAPVGTLGTRGGYGPHRISSIVVLPFRDLTGEEDDFYFADGMTDALIVGLSRLRSLRVISRPSALLFRDRSTSLGGIAVELGVDALVEGSVLRAADRVRITAHLIRAEPEEHLWSEAFDRELRDVIALHRELAEGIARRIELAVSEEEERRLAAGRPVDPAAYEAYLRGRHFTGMWPDIARAIEYYREATTLDPTFAEAFAGLGLCYMNLAIYGLLEPSSVVPPLERAVRTALELDPDSSDAHLGLGGYLGFGRRDVAGFRAALEDAVRLDPGSAHARAYHGGLLVAFGWPEEGLEECRQAARSDPLNPWILHVLGWAWYRIGRYQEALETYGQIVELHPRFPIAAPFLAQIRFQSGMHAGAVEACRTARAEHPDALVLGYGTAIMAGTGLQDESNEWLEALVALADERYVDPYYLAVAHAGRGESRRALEKLNEVCEGDSTSYWLAATEPFFDDLRDTRAFSGLLGRMGFSERR